MVPIPVTSKVLDDPVDLNSLLKLGSVQNFKSNAEKVDPEETIDKEESVVAKETVFPFTTSITGLIKDKKCSPLPNPLISMGQPRPGGQLSD